MPPPEQYKIYYRHKAQKEKYGKKHKEPNNYIVFGTPDPHSMDELAEKHPN